MCPRCRGTSSRCEAIHFAPIRHFRPVPRLAPFADGPGRPPRTPIPTPATASPVAPGVHRRHDLAAQIEGRRDRAQPSDRTLETAVPRSAMAVMAPAQPAGPARVAAPRVPTAERLAASVYLERVSPERPPERPPGRTRKCASWVSWLAPFPSGATFLPASTSENLTKRVVSLGPCLWPMVTAVRCSGQSRCRLPAPVAPAGRRNIQRSHVSRHHNPGRQVERPYRPRR